MGYCNHVTSPFSLLECFCIIKNLNYNTYWMRIYLVNFKQCLKITNYVASGLFFNRNKDLALHSFYLFFFTLLFSFFFCIVIVKEINSFTLFTSSSFPTHLCLSFKLRRTTCISPSSHPPKLHQFLIFKFFF